MSKPKLIALSGWKFSGKDTIANYLRNQYGFTRISFADRLKQEVSRQYRIPEELMHDPALKELGIPSYPAAPSDPFAFAIHELLTEELKKTGYWTPRALCILEGSVKRAVDPQYWVRQVLDIIDGVYQHWVITDMRYRSEAEQIRTRFPEAVLIRVNRFADIATNDPSERNLDNYKFDYVIDNSGTLERTYDQVDGIIEMIQLKDGSYGVKR